VAAVDGTSVRSLYRRFFSIKRHFSEKEINFFLNIDFANHVALVAVVREGGRRAIIGGGRYIVVRPGAAEVAFTVVDKYQGQGIGGSLMRHLTTLAREVGLKELIAEVLPENIPMLKVFENSGLKLSTKLEDEVVHVSFQLIAAVHQVHC
jgi:RimJ/RimL family protein N-acetyltransferase